MKKIILSKTSVLKGVLVAVAIAGSLFAAKQANAMVINCAPYGSFGQCFQLVSASKDTCSCEYTGNENDYCYIEDAEACNN